MIYPCPYCGSREITVEEYNSELPDSPLYLCHVTCDCGVAGPAFNTEQQAIKKWNTFAKKINGNFRMNEAKMKYGYRYQLSPEWQEFFNKDMGYEGFNFAVPVKYCDGCIIGDCWIINEQGKVHPGFCNKPYPLNASVLSNPTPCRFRQTKS